MCTNKKHAENLLHARGKFSGRIGYVLAVAGSAVGLGNIWRFPYLAAKYGGGMFLLVYLILMVTFGYVMIVSETALGRMTKKSPVGAFHKFGKSLPFHLGGWINAVIPMMIVPYYSVIGGWVLKYLFEYIRGNANLVAQDGYFNSFITSSMEVEIWFLIFAALVFIVILAGVKNGVERVSKVMMPLLILLAACVAVYSITRPGAVEGIKYFLIPNLENFSWMTVVAAMGQMFYSLSIAMGILYTYGSYIGKDVDIEKSTTQVEIFDTGVALLAGLMIIPAVIAFNGGDPSQVNSGPGLMFITLPMVFDSMKFGTIIGAVFFLLVLFAALTSSISLMETLVSVLMDKAHMKRKTATIVITASCLLIGMLSCLGYGPWATITVIGMQFLDFFDFISNSVLMPIVALLTCILIGHVVGTKVIANEVKEGAGSFHREKLHRVMVRWVAPVMLAAILASELATKVFHLFTI